MYQNRNFLRDFKNNIPSKYDDKIKRNGKVGING